jgi:hypothetical protein
MKARSRSNRRSNQNHFSVCLLPEADISRQIAMSAKRRKGSSQPTPLDTISFVEIRIWTTIQAWFPAHKGDIHMSGRILLFVTIVVTLAGFKTSATAQTAPKLDYEFFKSRVEPIFLAKRAGHARCYACHLESNNALRLEKLPANARSWTEEQSHRNFETVSKLVNPGDLNTSRLLQHPLAPEDGGDVFHSGGRQFESKKDPAWRTLAAWVNGAKLAAPKN